MEDEEKSVKKPVTAQAENTEKQSLKDIKVEDNLTEKAQEEVTTPTEEQQDGGNWFSSLSGLPLPGMQAMKQKTNEMFQYLRQDFTELSDTMTEVGRDLKGMLTLDGAAKNAVSAVGDTMNSLMDQMSTIFGVGPDDDDEPIVVGSPRVDVMSRIKAKVYSLAVDANIFLSDPENLADYEKWLETFDLETKHDNMTELMEGNPHLQLHYSQLVPDKVSHLLFWHRFYYQVHLIVQAEERSSKMKKAVNKTPTESADQGDQASGSDSGMVEISEEDQKRLLAEYEEEMRKEEESEKNSRRSSGAHLSSSSSGSFAFVTHDPVTDEVKVD